MAASGGGEHEGQEQVATGRAGRPLTNRGEDARGEIVERVDHAKGSHRIPTIPPIEEDVLELDDNARKTEKMNANHFRALLGPTAMLASLPPIPAPPPTDTMSPPIQHEELASSGLIEQALAQIKAGARIRLDSDSDASNLDDDDSLEKLRRAPSTIPMTMRQVSEIEATKDARPALAMAPLTRPPDGTPAPKDLPRITTPTGEIIELTKPAALPQMQRMQRIARFETEEPVAATPRRTDSWMLIAVVVLILSGLATVAVLLAR